MNVLIVDDEPVIRRGMRELVDWEGSGFRLVGEAEDGEEALRRMGEERVELLVTDLLMPRMDGLELIRRAREADPELGIVVLSCLDDFAWVKEAMKLGAKDYIHKPAMEPENLIAVLSEVRAQVTQAREAGRRARLGEEEAASNRHNRLAGEITLALTGGTWSERLERELFSAGPLASLLFYSPPGFPACPSLAALPAPSGEGESAWTAGFALPAGALWAAGASAGVRLYPDLADASEHARFQAGCRRAEALIREYLGFAGVSREDWRQAGGFVGLGPRIASAAGLSQAASGHREQLRRRFYRAGAGPLEVLEPSAGPRGAEAPLPLEAKTRCLRAAASGNAEGVRDSLRDLLGRVAADEPHPAALLPFARELAELGFSLSAAGRPELAEAAELHLAELGRVADAAGFGRWLEQAGALWTGAPGGLVAEASRNPFVRRATAFMLAHYAEPIDTAAIADHVRLSRAYLSDLYRKETGETLSETLLGIRIREAENRLAAGSKVYEAAAAVGIPDARVFAKAFKKMTGRTPKAFAERPRR